MKRTAIYARYSSDKQSGESIRVQIGKSEEFCQRQGFLVTEIFTDEAKTGTTQGGRVEYARMLEMAGAGGIDAIVAYKYDRIGRSFVETVRSVYELERYYNVQVYSATEPNDPLVRNILLSVAEDFSRQLGNRVIDSLSSNASQGFHCGGKPPYGYVGVTASEPSGRTDHKGSPIKHVIFQVHPEQGPIVQGIFRAYADGISMNKIAAALNDEGVNAPGGGSWDVSAVRYILHNEAYRGWRIWNKTKKIRKPDGKKTYRHRPRLEWVITKDAHVAIVDDDLWDTVEAAKKRKERFRANKGGDRTPYSKYLLSGFLKCEECGGNYIAHSPRGRKTGKYAYYRCGYHQRRGNSVCANSTSLPLKRIEGAVLDLLQNQILTKDNVQELVQDVRDNWTQPDGEKTRVVEGAEKALRKVEKEIRNLVEAVKATGITASLQAELERSESRKAALEHDLEELRSVRPDTEALPTEQEVHEALKGFRCLLESGTPQERRSVLEENIEQILVKPTGETLLKANPRGLLPIPDSPFGWCRGPDSNRHGL